jgi:2-dehydro-3-deoxyphosphogluconate aldolase/(4S)-4-hydroxy-2-oxoglutarate aldolase
MSKQDIALAIRSQRVIAIVRSASSDEALAAAQSLLQAGLLAVEVSLVTPEALAVISRLVQSAPSGAYIGAGTVLSAEQVLAAQQMGAQFIVAPTVDPDVIDSAVSEGLLVVPGASTPTEATKARSLGADLVKLFPASAWTPAVMGDVLAALPDIDFVPTGGVTLADAPNWVAAGAVAVGLGSALTRGDAEAVRARAVALLASLAAASVAS